MLTPHDEKNATTTKKYIYHIWSINSRLSTVNTHKLNEWWFESIESLIESLVIKMEDKQNNVVAYVCLWKRISFKVKLQRYLDNHTRKRNLLKIPFICEKFIELKLCLFLPLDWVCRHWGQRAHHDKSVVNRVEEDMAFDVWKLMIFGNYNDWEKKRPRVSER